MRLGCERRAIIPLRAISDDERGLHVAIGEDLPAAVVNTGHRLRDPRLNLATRRRRHHKIPNLHERRTTQYRILRCGGEQECALIDKFFKRQ